MQVMRTFGRICCLLTLAALPGTGQTQDVRLNALKATLESLRPHGSEHTESRGATPQLTLVKHQLREWIESRLPPELRPGDEAALATELNAALAHAKLFCDSNPGAHEGECPYPTYLGYLEAVELHWQGEFLIVQTAAGIQCGYDASAYIYERTATVWRRNWESEQSDYRENLYAPQNLLSVQVSALAEKNDFLVLTLGTHPWCTSNWRPVYYRIWRMSPLLAAPKLLMDKTESAYLGAAIP